MLLKYDALGANPFALSTTVYSTLMSSWLNCFDSAEKHLGIETGRQFGGEPDVFPPLETTTE
jgi:hypothetical protein